MTLLEIKNVSSGYGKVNVLENIDLYIDQCEIVAILGPNGSGKTTLLNTIAGLANIFSGSIIFEGKEISRIQPHKLPALGLAYSPQTDNVFPNFTVEQNLMMGAYIKSGSEVKEDMEEVFRFFPEIDRRRHNLAKTLSGGERQMLALGRALALRPKLIMLDEPTAGLSPKAANSLTEKIREIRDKNTTILLVEQNANISLSLSDRAYLLVGGRMVATDTSANMRNRKDLEQIYFK